MPPPTTHMRPAWLTTLPKSCRGDHGAENGLYRGVKGANAVEDDAGTFDGISHAAAIASVALNGSDAGAEGQGQLLRPDNVPIADKHLVKFARLDQSSCGDAAYGAATAEHCDLGHNGNPPWLAWASGPWPVLDFDSQP